MIYDQKIVSRNRFQRTLEEKIADYRENSFIATDPFTNETTPQICPNGRIRRDHFRGLGKEYYYHTADVQRHQAEYGAELAKALVQQFCEDDVAQGLRLLYDDFVVLLIMRVHTTITIAVR